MRTLGTLTVTTENQANAHLKYSFANEFVEAKDVALEAKTTLVSNGNNDLVSKFTVAADGDYDIKVECQSATEVQTYVFDKDGMVVKTSNSNDTLISMSDLKAGETYYVKVIPYVYDYYYDDYYYYVENQKICTVDLLVERRRTPQKKAIVIPLNSSKEVTTTLDETNFIKVFLEAGKEYTLSFSD